LVRLVHHAIEELVSIAHTGHEGKWFAATKESGFWELAIKLARASPRDPKTLIRAARDFNESNSVFALEAGLAALHRLGQGYGYELTGAKRLVPELVNSSETLTPRNLESSWSPPSCSAPAGLSRPLRAVAAALGGP
jgi:hypothetical protein